MALAAAHGITLAHGGFTVRLRPTLRAAAILERLHDGYATLFKKLGNFDTATVKAVIEVSATDKKAAAAFLAHAATLPLKTYSETTMGPLYALCNGLIPTPPKSTGKPARSNPMPWAEVYADLFRTATGWLGWPPDMAWNTTPDEITEAFTGHLAKLKAIHGEADGETRDTTPDERESNLAAGLDPDFDRNGLRALKARHTQGTPR